MHACIHTYIHTYIHQYIHTCIQTDRQTDRQTCLLAYTALWFERFVAAYATNMPQIYEPMHTYVFCTAGETAVKGVFTGMLRQGRVGSGTLPCDPPLNRTAAPGPR